jgi:hypothetical protein
MGYISNSAATRGKAFTPQSLKQKANARAIRPVAPRPKPPQIAQKNANTLGKVIRGTNSGPSGY